MYIEVAKHEVEALQAKRFNSMPRTDEAALSTFFFESTQSEHPSPVTRTEQQSQDRPFLARESASADLLEQIIASRAEQIAVANLPCLELVPTLFVEREPSALLVLRTGAT